MNFFFHFCNLHQILNIWKKKMMVIANVFPKLQTVKNFVTPLCKKRRFVRRLDSWHMKVFQIPAKSPWECFYHGFSSIWRKLIYKISPLGLGGIWGLFVNTLFQVWNLYQILKIFWKKMTVIANMFPKLQTVKNFATPLCKKRRFGARLDCRHVKVSRILAKSPWECFYHVFHQFEGIWLGKYLP